MVVVVVVVVVVVGDSVVVEGCELEAMVSLLGSCVLDCEIAGERVVLVCITNGSA